QVRELRKNQLGGARAAAGSGRRIYLGLFAPDAMKLAMVFPGQGSQAVGMLRGYDGLPEIDRVIAEARAALGGEFVRLMNEGPAEALNQTVNTQHAMLTA